MPRVRVSTARAKFKLRGRFWAHVVVTNTRGELWIPVLVFRSLWFWLLTWWEFFRLVDLEKPLLNRFMFVFLSRSLSYTSRILIQWSSAVQCVTRYLLYNAFVGKLVDTSHKSQYRILI